MKKLISLILAIVMFLMTAVAFSEETSDVEAEIEKSVSELTTTEEEEAYKTYFEAAYIIVKYTRNASVNMTNFLTIRSKFSGLMAKDYSFLLEIVSPLELNQTQMEAMHSYSTAVSKNSTYKSYLDSTIGTAMIYCNTLPAYWDVFETLTKPAVPEKYAFVDSCIEKAVAESKRVYDEVVLYLQGKITTIPDYDTTMFDYVKLVDDLL